MQRLPAKGDDTLRMMTMLRRAALMALVLCLAWTLAAADISEFTFALNGSGTGYVVTGYSGSGMSVTVPDWYEGKPVTEIGDGAFRGNTAIQSVALPSSVARIGKSAFQGCSALTTITSYTAAAQPPADANLPGDANQNGRVDASDALLILQHEAGWSVTLDQERADVDDSGAVDLADALLIFRYCAGEAVTLK